MTKEHFFSIVKWQSETFPTASTFSKIKHLQQEVEELLFEITTKGKGINHEFADCFMLLFGAAASEGLSYDDICKSIDEKMQINKARKWGKPDKNGVQNHIK